MPIIISKEGKKAKKIEETSFEHEQYLQKYIYENPETLPLEDYKENIRLFIVAREFPTESGYIDALGVDADGEVYIVETKLYRNPDKRLVVAQVLDYGASLWRGYNDFTDFIRILDMEVNKKFKMGLNQKLMEFFAIDEEDVSNLLDNIKKNLNDGRFRFVVLMDKLHDSLKDLILFVNQNSRFDIFGVELDFYKYHDFEILIPRLYGSEVKKNVDISKSKSTRQWDEISLFEELKKRKGDEEYAVGQKILRWAQKNMTYDTWGKGYKNGSYIPVFDYKGIHYWPFALWTSGVIEIQFQYLKDKKPFDDINARKILMEKINEIKGVNITEESIAKRPSIHLSLLTDDVSLQKLLSIFDWIITEIKTKS